MGNAPVQIYVTHLKRLPWLPLTKVWIPDQGPLNNDLISFRIWLEMNLRAHTDTTVLFRCKRKVEEAKYKVLQVNYRETSKIWRLMPPYQVYTL